MTVWILESAYFGMFKVFATLEAAQAWVALAEDIRLMPYAEGYVLQTSGRFSAIGTLLPYEVCA